MYKNEDAPCTVCESKGFRCTKEDKIRGPKTEERTRSTNRSTEFAGQFVFSVNRPSSVQPAEPICTPNKESASTPRDHEDSFLNTNLFPDALVDESFGYTTNLKPVSLSDEILWDDWTWLGSPHTLSLSDTIVLNDCSCHILSLPVVVLLLACFLSWRWAITRLRNR